MTDELIVVADDDALDEINDFISEHLEEVECDAKKRFQLELAVEEIVVNIVSYAYEGGEAPEDSGEDPFWGKIRVALELTEDPAVLTLSFMDQGSFFDPLAAEEADTSGKMFMERVGGFGILMVKETMDDVSYVYRDGTNILTIKKNL
ncbi:MAG: ATP-binding protein [Lachnospiraceae bacterium]|nr:ATP-binding protein [Lachnospiraceae bacterium]